MKHTIRHRTVPRKTFGEVDQLIDYYSSQLDTFDEQLLWWNERINLVSRNVSRETIREHIRHSLLLSQFSCFKQAAHIVDAGTGGGLPGLPLAVASPEKSFWLNDIVTKKVMAVKQIVQKLGLHHVQTVDGSIGELGVEHPFLLISKHAFKINELVEMVRKKPWTHLVFYKGDDFEHELEDIVMPLTIDVYNLFADQPLGFYQGKNILIVERDPKEIS